MGKEHLQELVAELQVIDAHVKEFRSQSQALEEQMMEAAYTKESLAALQDAGTSVLAQFSSGIFIPAQITGKDRLIVNVGSNIAVEKGIPETISLMERQVKEIDGIRKTIGKAMQRLIDRAMAIDAEISRIGG